MQFQFCNCKLDQSNCKGQLIAKQFIVYNNISTRYVTKTNQIYDMKISIKCKKN